MHETHVRMNMKCLHASELFIASGRRLRHAIGVLHLYLSTFTGTTGKGGRGPTTTIRCDESLSKCMYLVMKVHFEWFAFFLGNCLGIITFQLTLKGTSS